MPKRLLVMITATLFALGVLAAPAAAHHDGFGELPERNPHAQGLPQELWDVGVEVGVFPTGEEDPPFELAAAHGAPEEFAAEFPFVPVSIGEDLDWEEGSFWIVLHIGVLTEEQGFDAIKIEDWAFTATLHSQMSPDDPIESGDLVDPRTGDSIDFETDFVWFLVYPHEHHLILHADTPRERCLDLSAGRVLPPVNQHNAVHIGVPGTQAFPRAGHEIHPGPCP